MRAFFFFVFFDMSVEVTGAAVWFLAARNGFVARSLVPGDRSSADNGRQDDHPSVDRPGSPRVRGSPDQPTQQLLVDDLPQVAANQHAPPGFGDGIDVICLERDTYPASQGVQHRIASRSERDLPIDDRAVDRQHERLAVIHESNPADDDTIDEAPADSLLEVLVVHGVLMLGRSTHGSIVTIR